jgi:hypothetical protein
MVAPQRLATGADARCLDARRLSAEALVRVRPHASSPIAMAPCPVLWRLTSAPQFEFLSYRRYLHGPLAKECSLAAVPQTFSPPQFSRIADLHFLPQPIPDTKTSTKTQDPSTSKMPISKKDRVSIRIVLGSLTATTDVLSRSIASRKKRIRRALVRPSTLTEHPSRHRNLPRS